VPRAHEQLGNLLAGEEDWAGAEVAYQAAIDTADPNWTPIAQIDLAVLRWQRDDTGEARIILQQAIASPASGVTAYAYGVLGDLLAVLGNTAESEEAYEAVIATGDPEAGQIASERLAQLRHPHSAPDGSAETVPYHKPAEAAARARRDWLA
jgi:predicted negative regulator of RcsB-dependent stress response